MSDDTLVAALARAQLNMPPIAKNHENPHFKSRYADIADVLAVVRPVLAKEGIAITQTTRVTDAGCELVTCLLKGDDRLESAMPLQIDQKAQDLGSRLTYLRRYALCALVGVAAEDDDDGHAASNAPPRTKTRQAAYEPRERSYPSERPVGSGQAPGTPGKPSTDAQRNAIEKLGNKLIKKYGWSPVELSWVMSSSVGKEAPDVMTVSEASKLMDDLIAIDKGEQHATFTDDGALIGNPASLAADGTEAF